MTRTDHSLPELLIYGVAFSLAIAAALLSRGALGASFDTSRPTPAGPRWSNDHHLADGLTVTPDCVTLQPDTVAPYVPGRDAWGHPVPPADTANGPHGPGVPPVELEVHLGYKTLGGQRVDLTLPRVHYDAAGNSVNGYRLDRDCTPLAK